MHNARKKPTFTKLFLALHRIIYLLQTWVWTAFLPISLILPQKNRFRLQLPLILALTLATVRDTLLFTPTRSSLTLYKNLAEQWVLINIRKENLPCFSKLQRIP